MAKKDKKFSMKQKIFGIFIILISLVMVCYGISLNFETISSIRFILGGVFLFILAVAFFKNKINTKLIGVIFLIYLILDVLLVILFSSTSVSVSTSLIIKIVFILTIIYFLFIKKKN